ncbi:MAG TPA: tetratricopeptide repeat protein [Bryobacteraceae bacterium]|nr:tetratricopeptide repeat protein [Bryobacteraceae bacterium]
MTSGCILSFPPALIGCLLLSASALAFQTGGSTAPPGGGTGGGTTPPPSSGGTTTPGSPSTGSSQTQTSNQQRTGTQQTQPQEFRRPVFLSGRLITEEGTPPPEPAVIELYCNGRARPYGYSDSKGRFNITLGQQPSMIGADASVGSINDSFGGRNSPFGSTDSVGSMGGVSERDLMGCELRASLPGYLSESINLAGRRLMDNPDVGSILMRRLGKIEAQTTSYTSLSAPKDARKAFEKGQGRNKKQKYEEAQFSLSKAVELHPQYAEAWYELGVAYARLKRPEDASASFKKAIESDAKYVRPHLGLMELALSSNGSWDQILAASGNVLKLDPYSYPQAWYFSSLAHLQLQHFDEAEKSARETIKLDRDKRFPKVHHILGVALANKNDFGGAAGSLKSYLELNPNGKDSEFVRKQLADFEQRVSQRE